MNSVLKVLATGVVAAGFASTASAQFDGPTPLAWRWVPQKVEYSPSGPPVLVNHTVYVAAAGRIYALDENTGNEKWKFPAVDSAKGTFRPQPVITNGFVIDYTDAGWFYAADAVTGAAKWTNQIRLKQPVGDPIGVGGIVIFKQSDQTLNAIKVDTGEPAWEKPLSIETGFNGPLLVNDGNVIFFNNNNEMFSVNAVTQKINWKRRFGNVPPGVVPAMLGDMIYMYSGQYLVAINAIRGTGKWQVNLGETMEYGPAVSGDGMVCVTEDGRLYFFDLNGRRALREVVDLGSGPAAPPAAIGTKYLIPTNNGALNLVDPKSGQIVWSYAVHPIGGVAQKQGSGPVATGGGIVDNRILTVPAAGPAILDDGRMMILAQDASLLVFDNKLGVDLTPPNVDMLWPAPGTQLPGNPPLDLIFKVADETTGVNVSTLKIDMDGKPLTFTVGRDGVAVVRITYNGPNLPLPEGRRIFNVTVSDWMGNVATKSYSLSVDNQLPPLNTPEGLKTNPGGKNGGGGKGGGGAGGGGGGGGIG